MSWYLESGPQGDVVFSTRVRLARNLSTLPFPQRMSDAQAAALVDQVRTALFGENGQMAGLYRAVPLQDLSDEAAQALVEERLISEALLARVKDSGGRRGAVFISRDEALSVMVDEEDHIRIQAMAPGLNIDVAYARAEELALLLEQTLPIAHRPDRGFLTACPTNTGTGMRASVMVHLPALTHNRQMGEVARVLERMNFTVRGAHGENTAAEACLYQVSNQATLGVSEGQVCQELNQVAAFILSLERKARRQVQASANLALADQLYRNFGVLRHARQLSGQEALERLSQLSLAVSLGYLTLPADPKGVDVVKQAFALAAPGVLQRRLGRPLAPDERDRARADLLRALLKPMAEATLDDRGRPIQDPHGGGATDRTSAPSAGSAADTLLDDARSGTPKDDERAGAEP